MKKKRNPVKIILWVLAAVLVLGVGLNFARNRRRTNAAATTPQYDLIMAASGNIEQTATGNGIVMPVDSVAVNAASNGKVTSIAKQNGDLVEKGDLILSLVDSSLNARIATAQNTLAQIDSQIAMVRSTTGSSSIKAPVNGKIMAVFAGAGDDASAMSYIHGGLCLLSTDGRSVAVFTPLVVLKPGDKVTVTVDGNTIDGIVSTLSNSNGMAEALIQSDDFVFSQPAEIQKDGIKAGDSTLFPNRPLYVTASSGTVDEVKATVGESYDRNATLFTLKGTILSDQLTSLLIQRAQAQADLDAANDQAVNLNITAPTDGVIVDMAMKLGSQVVQDGLVCTVQSNTAFKMTTQIDELDISYVKLGQNAVVYVDALLNTSIEATVTHIAQVGQSTNNVSTFDVELTLKTNPGLMAGMSGSGDIAVANAQNATLLPSTAIQTIQGEKYVLPAAAVGKDTEVNPEDKSTLTPVKVGIISGGYAQILEGINPGDEVAVLKTGDDANNFMFGGARLR